MIHNLIKPRKFNCVFAVIRGISSALPRWAAEFTKFAAEFVIFCRGKLWALFITYLSNSTTHYLLAPTFLFHLVGLRQFFSLRFKGLIFDHIKSHYIPTTKWSLYFQSPFNSTPVVLFFHIFSTCSVLCLPNRSLQPLTLASSI